MARPNVAVVGLGGAGSNIVSWIKQRGVSGGKLIAANTDAAHLGITKADRRLLIGEKLTHGTGCGGYPERGERAAMESMSELKKRSTARTSPSFAQASAEARAPAPSWLSQES